MQRPASLLRNDWWTAPRSVVVPASVAVGVLIASADDAGGGYCGCWVLALVSTTASPQAQPV
jgi:hypothetical protein